MKYIRCLAVSTDGKFLVSLIKQRRQPALRTTEFEIRSFSQVAGDAASKEVQIYSGDELNHIKSLQGHRGPISGVVFRRDTHTLYSASDDRSVKVWNLDDMAYVESMWVGERIRCFSLSNSLNKIYRFGHQNGITSIDALSRERAITSGGYDGTIRIWKIVEESQLIFNGHSGSIDSVKLINEENFLSCGDDGHLCVWGSMKKKPLCSVPEAHGKDQDNGRPTWISSIATLLNTDLVASGTISVARISIWTYSKSSERCNAVSASVLGSRDGVIRLWQCGDAFRTLNPLLEIKITGFVNSLAFTPDGKNLVAGVGQEHRLGRWWRVPEAKNSIVVIPLIRKSEK